MTTQKRVLIQHDESASRDYSLAWGMARKRTQEVVDAFHSLSLPKLQTKDFERLFCDFDNLLFDKLTGGAATIGSAKISKTKALEMLEMPDGFIGFKELLRTYTNDAVNCLGLHQNAKVLFAIQSIAEHFYLDVDGLVQLTDKLKEQIKEVGKLYITDPKSIVIYELLKSTVGKFFELGLDREFSRELQYGKPLASILQVIKSIGTDGSFTIDTTILSKWTLHS